MSEMFDDLVICLQFCFGSLMDIAARDPEVHSLLPHPSLVQPPPPEGTAFFSVTDGARQVWLDDGVRSLMGNVTDGGQEYSVLLLVRLFSFGFVANWERLFASMKPFAYLEIPIPPRNLRLVSTFLLLSSFILPLPRGVWTDLLWDLWEYPHPP